MDVIISDTKKELGQKAAVQGAELIREAIAIRGEANIVVATGHHNSKFLKCWLRKILIGLLLPLFTLMNISESR